jgi:Flp pilus assembly protein TadB
MFHAFDCLWRGTHVLVCICACLRVGMPNILSYQMSLRSGFCFVVLAVASAWKWCSVRHTTQNQERKDTQQDNTTQNQERKDTQQDNTTQNQERKDTQQDNTTQNQERPYVLSSVLCCSIVFPYVLSSVLCCSMVCPYVLSSVLFSCVSFRSELQHNTELRT